jgi:hypothetical protein
MSLAILPEDDSMKATQQHPPATLLHAGHCTTSTTPCRYRPDLLLLLGLAPLPDVCSSRMPGHLKSS